MNIQEDYVSFETAKLLKKKGFDADISIPHAVYSLNDGTFINLLQFIGNTSFINYNLEKCVVAPTLQMAMKWLREVHNMYYEIQLLLGEKAEKYGDFQLGIYQLNSSRVYIWKDWIYADTYIELYENYIKYCLENLINKN